MNIAIDKHTDIWFRYSIDDDGWSEWDYVHDFDYDREFSLRDELEALIDVYSWDNAEWDEWTLRLSNDNGEEEIIKFEIQEEQHVITVEDIVAVLDSHTTHGHVMNRLVLYRYRDSDVVGLCSSLSLGRDDIELLDVTDHYMGSGWNLGECSVYTTEQDRAVFEEDGYTVHTEKESLRGLAEWLLEMI